MKSKVIAFAGKGGVGKTSICGMLIQYLCDSGRKPVLAVDADTNSNLNEVLGVDSESTVGRIQEELKRSGYIEGPVKGVDKSVYTELKLNQSLAETKNFDLMTIGRSQGKGCYCHVNGILEKEMSKIHDTYPYVVVDNEAGMEHLSRGILPDMDVLILVSDCSRRGIQAAGRISRLMRELDMRPRAMGLIVNRAPNGQLNEGTLEEIKKQKLNLIGVVSKDNTVYEYDCAGKPLVEIPESAIVKREIKKIAETMQL